MDDLTAISVAYNSHAVLPGMADCLPAGTRLIVVDNGPDDGLRDWAAGRGVKLLIPGENLGFGRACNLGAAAADSTFLLFLNPDARPAPDAIAHLLAAAARHPTAAAFGPVLINAGGQVRYKRNSYLLRRAAKPPRDPGPEDRAVSVLSGAALMVRRDAFQKVGGFDPRIFLYFEDDDLCLRLRQFAGPLILVPAARVGHAAGTSSTPSAALSRFKGYHWARSRVHVGRKHGVRLPWLGGLWDGISHLASPKSWSDAAHRGEALGRVQGALSMWRSQMLERATAQ